MEYLLVTPEWISTPTWSTNQNSVMAACANHQLSLEDVRIWSTTCEMMLRWFVHAAVFLRGPSCFLGWPVRAVCNRPRPARGAAVVYDIQLCCRRVQGSTRSTDTLLSDECAFQKGVSTACCYCRQESAVLPKCSRSGLQGSTHSTHTLLIDECTSQKGISIACCCCRSLFWEGVEILFLCGVGHLV